MNLLTGLTLSGLALTALPVLAALSRAEAPDATPTCCTAGSPCQSALAAPRDAKAPTLACIKELAGTWVQVGEDGQPGEQVISQFAVTAGGNAVIETLFPGSEHEMVSVYFTDGEDLVLSHFCVLGAHPRLIATREEATGDVVFRCPGAGNNFKQCAETHHMHEGRMRRVGDDRIECRWTPLKDGQAEEAVTFVLARREER